MATIKNLNTIIKALNDTTDETLAAIINNEAVDVEAMSAKDKLCTLVFDALRKGIDTSKYQVVLDCNFANSKFHNHEDEAEDVYRVDYYRVIPTAAPTVSLIQIYPKPTRGVDGIQFDLCTSCKKAVADAIAELGFNVQYNNVTKKPKTSSMRVSYDDIVSTVKSLLAILADAEKQKEAAKTEKRAAKKEEKKEMTVEDMVNTIAEVLSENVA